jgi:hypothetical protein
MLSSPPPTVTAIKKELGNVNPFTHVTPEQLSNSSTEEIVRIFHALKSENQALAAAAAEARMSAAHHKLQHSLLTIETEEAALRAEVEHEMTRREVQALQRMIQGPESQAGREYVTRLKAYCHIMQDKNQDLQKRLMKAKKLITERDDEISMLMEEKKMLMTRLRENREHMNYLRSPGGIFHLATPKISNSSYPATPQQHRNTPKHTPMTGHSVRRDHSQEPFAALLLADRVLSQENNSAPSTPLVGRRADPQTPMGHNRGVQSMSSIPNTPRSARTGPSTLLPSAPITSHAEKRAKHSTGQERGVVQRRRKSRDSTISLSDTEEIARAAMSYREESEEVQESRASQSATEMLRIDPRESFEVAASRAATPANEMVQTKIVGAVSKRKRDEEIYGDNKKLRSAEAVGLGIGYGK